MRRIHLPRDEHGDAIDPIEDLRDELDPPQADHDEARREAAIAQAMAILT